MIKNIIFDIGDVLVEYRWKDMLMYDYGCSKEDAMHIGSLVFDNELWHKFDLGIMSDEEIINTYMEMYPKYGKIIEWFISNGELMRVDRPDIWELVHKLKLKGYNIYLLSNYSEILYKKHTNGAAFFDDADGLVISYQIHKAKPDPEIYKYLLNKYNLNAEECIFFDDRAENTLAATKLGISATTITSKDQLSGILKGMLEI